MKRVHSTLAAVLALGASPALAHPGHQATADSVHGFLYHLSMPVQTAIVFAGAAVALALCVKALRRSAAKTALRSTNSIS
jgi:hypothetical protein